MSRHCRWSTEPSRTLDPPAARAVVRSNTATKPVDRRPAHVTSSLLWLAVLFVCVGSLHADVIILKNGNKLRGKIRNEVGDRIEVELPYGKMWLNRRQIEEIRRESDGEYLEKTGEKLLRHRDLDKGVEYLRRAHRAEPTASTKRSLLRGLVLGSRAAIEKRRYDRAEKLVDEARELAPDHDGISECAQDIRHARSVLASLETLLESAEIDQNLTVAYDTAKRLLGEFPEQRERFRTKFARLSVLRGHTVLRDRRFEEARDLYHDALAHDPDLIEFVKVPLGFCEVKTVVPILESGDFRRAKEQLTRAYEILPGHPAIVYYLAVTEEGSGNLSRAADLYATLAGPDHETIRGESHVVALRRAAESELSANTTFELRPPVRRWSDAARNPGRLESRNFVVHYTVPERGREVSRHLEHHLRRLKSKWFRGAHPLRKKVNVYLHPDEATFRDAVSPPSWSSGLTRHEYKFGRCFNHEIHFDASAPQFQTATLPHELCHVLLPEYLAEGVRPPRWLDEGLATTEEPEFKQRYYARLVQQAVDAEELFPLEQLLALADYPEADRAPLFYAQSNSLTRYLIARLGLREAMKFLAEVATGPAEQVVAESREFESIGHLENQWRKWLQRSG